MKLSLCGVILLVVGCSAPSSAPSSAVSSPELDGARAPRPCPVWTVEVDARLDPSWPEPIADALDAWSVAMGGALEHRTAIVDAPSSTPRACVLAIDADPRLLDEEDAAGFTDPTMIDPAGERFGHIRLLPGARPYEGARALAIHEIGHFIGLPHSDAVGSVMHLPLQVPATITDADAAAARAAWAE